MTTQKRTRRPKGSGGEWRDEKGVWHIRIDATPDPRTGNRRRITATGPTRTAARQKLRAKLDAMERSGTLPLTDIPTLDVWIDRWLKTITPNVKPRTLETYTSDCNTIRSRIGGMKLDKITAATIEHMCADLAKTHSSKTVHNHYIRLKQILQAAVREKLIPSNPALAAIPPRYTSQATAILKAGQPAKMAEAARKPAKRKHDHLADTDDDREMWSLMWNLAFETGMRQAERFAILPEELATIDGVHGIQIMWELQRFKSDAEVPNWLRAPATTRAASGSSNPKANRATGSCPSATRRGSDSGRSSDADNASPASSYSRARDTRSPTPWNAAAGNAPSKTPDCPTSRSEAPATSSAPTSPKPEPRRRKKSHDGPRQNHHHSRLHPLVSRKPRRARRQSAGGSGRSGLANDSKYQKERPRIPPIRRIGALASWRQMFCRSLYRCSRPSRSTWL